MIALKKYLKHYGYYSAREDTVAGVLGKTTHTLGVFAV